ncbi:hypothetical protein ACLHDG_06320 [Sulfurovum sp. CS9]|uniref:hypothetical protein n=1 Tax=Sulfurovum sp. CS9 TaxID=3391146 RepID=UPI0039EC89E5
MKRMLLLLSLTGTILFAGNGAELIKANCASCHMLTSPTPDMIPTLKAPAMDAVMFHIKLDIKKKKDIKDFIVDYTQDPAAAKSVCESNKVQKFGVMPSLKGKVSEQDLVTIAEYMIDNYPAEKFVGMIKEIQRNDKISALINSPFLINQSRLPHMTKVLLQNWDKALLGLSEAQKEKLLVVRKETMSAVMKVKKQVKVLEAEIIEAMVDGEEPKSVYAKVDNVAKLKAEATRAHLNCISDTISILTDEQLEFLFPFWDM